MARLGGYRLGIYLRYILGFVPGFPSGGPSANANKVEGLRFFLKADDGTKLFANDHQTGGSWVTGENQIQRFSTHLIT